MKLPGGDTPGKRVRRHLNVIFDRIDRAIERSLEAGGRTLTCSVGCAHCCHLPVQVTSIEAIAAVEAYVHTHGLAAFHERVWPRVLYALEHTVGITDEGARFDAQIPCPFLEDRACAIYDTRPTACRTHNSLSDPALCAPPSVPQKEIERAGFPNLDIAAAQLQALAIERLGMEVVIIGYFPAMMKDAAIALKYAP